MKRADRIKAAIGLVSWATEKAIQIASEPPYSIHIDEPQFVTLTIHTEMVVMRWPRRAGDYAGLDVRMMQIPVKFLFLGDEERRAWAARLRL
jgi:hypothetical protein